MAKRCEICGKGPQYGNSISHSHRKTRRRWEPNLRPVKINENGTIRKARVCTRCLRSGKVVRA